MNEKNELMVTEERLSLEQVKAQVGAIQSMMGSVMQEGQHFGKIPGCGDKPTLLKPGAEKIAFMFKLVPDFEKTIEKMENYHREYEVTCKLYRDEKLVGTGFGSCSTLEKKFRYKKKETVGEKVRAVPKSYWDAKKAQDFDAMKQLAQGLVTKKIDNAWYFCTKGEVEYIDDPDIADKYNTVLKIAKKRAFVDAVITATGASDFFTQDIEDFRDSFEADEQRLKTPAQPAKAEPKAEPVETEAPKSETQKMKAAAEDAQVVGTPPSEEDTLTLRGLVTQLEAFKDQLDTESDKNKIAGVINKISDKVLSGDYTKESVAQTVEWVFNKVIV